MMYGQGRLPGRGQMSGQVAIRAGRQVGGKGRAATRARQRRAVPSGFYGPLCMWPVSQVMYSEVLKLLDKGTVRSPRPDDTAGRLLFDLHPTQRAAPGRSSSGGPRQAAPAQSSSPASSSRRGQDSPAARLNLALSAVGGREGNREVRPPWPVPASICMGSVWTKLYDGSSSIPATPRAQVSSAAAGSRNREGASEHVRSSSPLAADVNWFGTRTESAAAQRGWADALSSGASAHRLPS